MHSFFAVISSSSATISILDQHGTVEAERKIDIARQSLVRDFTEKMIDLSHEQELYHNDISAIGVIADPTRDLGWDSEQQFKQDLEASFGFPAIVGLNENEVKSELVSLASETK